jgi:hypothetical protein
MFLARDVAVMEARWVGNGEKHRKLRLRDGNLTWPAVAFDMPEIDVHAGDRMDVVYTLDAGSRNGDQMMEIRVEDMRPSDSATV